MLLVIFGAGASFDSVPQWKNRSGPCEAHRPPLAKDLFEDRAPFVSVMDRYPACKPVVPLLRTSTPIEEQLAAFEEQARQYPQRHSQLTAIRYYLHDMLWECQSVWRQRNSGITNFATFIDAIERWRLRSGEPVCLVTFNYDTMLEDAMSQTLGITFDNFGKYILNYYKLIRLHGSLDWGHVVVMGKNPTNPNDIIRAARDGGIGGGLGFQVLPEFRKLNGASLDGMDGQILLPALAIPVEKKRAFECPPEHLQALANGLREVTKIIAIGWRAMEQHFLEMLRERLTGLKGDVDLMVVSGSENGTKGTMANLGMNETSPCKRELVDSGFTGLVNNIGLLESFLR